MLAPQWGKKNMHCLSVSFRYIACFVVVKSYCMMMMMMIMKNAKMKSSCVCHATAVHLNAPLEFNSSSMFPHWHIYMFYILWSIEYALSTTKSQSLTVYASAIIWWIVVVGIYLKSALRFSMPKEYTYTESVREKGNNTMKIKHRRKALTRMAYIAILHYMILKCRRRFDTFRSRSMRLLQHIAQAIFKRREKIERRSNW